jgi:hypothetical protein
VLCFLFLPISLLVLLPFPGPSCHDSPLKAAIGVADENLGGVHLTCHPFGVADGVRHLPVPERVGSASGGLQEPFATVVRVRDDLEDYRLGTGQFSLSSGTVFPKQRSGLSPVLRDSPSHQERTSLRVPIGMRRPAGAREALRRGPPVKAGRAHASSVERVPAVPAGAGPEVLLPGRPAALRAADARA